MGNEDSSNTTGNPLCPSCGRVPLDTSGRCPLCGAWFAPSKRGNGEAQPVISSPPQPPPLSMPPPVRRPGEGQQFSLPAPAALDDPPRSTDRGEVAVFEPSRPRSGRWVIWLWILAGMATVGVIVYLMFVFLVPPPPRIPAVIIQPKKSAATPQRNPGKQGETTKR